MSDDSEDVAELLARSLVIGVSRAVRLSMLHRLENDAIAATAQGLRDAVDGSLKGTGGAAVKVGADGVFVNGTLVRAMGEVAESAERLQKHFVRLGVETLAFTSVPDEAAVRLLLAGFQGCRPGDASALLAMQVPGIRVLAQGQGRGTADEAALVVAAFVDVVVTLQDLQQGRVRKTAPLRSALQRLADATSTEGDILLGIIGAVCVGLAERNDTDPDNAATRAAASAGLVILVTVRGGQTKKDAVALAYITALCAPHASVDDVIAAANLLTESAPALAALRLELFVGGPVTGLAAVVAAVETAVEAWSTSGSKRMAMNAVLDARGRRFAAEDAAAVAWVLSGA